MAFLGTLTTGWRQKWLNILLSVFISSLTIVEAECRTLHGPFHKSYHRELSLLMLFFFFFFAACVFFSLEHNCFVCVCLCVRLFIDVVFTHLSQSVPQWIPVNIKQQTKSEKCKSTEKKRKKGVGKTWKKVIMQQGNKLCRRKQKKTSADTFIHLTKGATGRNTSCCLIVITC